MPKWISPLRSTLLALLLVASCTGVFRPAEGRAQSEPLLGEIILFAGNFAPRGWALCDGSLLQISQYSALFSILGTTYGGDGRTTFALPDLRGRVPIHAGNGPGLQNRSLGARGGAESTELPSHTHNVTLRGYSEEGNSGTPTNNSIAKNADGRLDYATEAPNTSLAEGSVNISFSGVPESNDSNMQPYLTLNYIIALQGIYPSRN